MAIACVVQKLECFIPHFFLQWGMWCKSLIMYFIFISLQFNCHVLETEVNTSNLSDATCFDNDGTYFNSQVFSRFVVSKRFSISLSFLSLNKTDVNCNCFKSFYENVSLDSLLLKKEDILVDRSITEQLSDYR